MPDLRATFTLSDNYSTKIEKVMLSTDRVAAAATKASVAVDKVNASLDKTGSLVPDILKVGNATEKMAKDIEKTEKAAKRAETNVKGLISVAGVLASLKTIMNASDTYSNANARIDLVNDGSQSSGQLQQKVFSSSQRSRTSYDSTANAVASLEMNAGNAFRNNDEAIMFVEAINKQFVIAGTSAAAAEGAMTQLTQAMGAGALRGEELNSILDAAPSIARNIEKYMGWAEGSIKSYAEKGEVSAELVKNAQLNALEEINAKYNTMPYTWSQIWTMTMGKILWASQPVLNLVSFMANNWSIIAPILAGVAVGIGVYMTAVHGAETATRIWTAAQTAFNAVMALNPVALAILGIVVLASLLYAGVAAWNKYADASVSATGLIAGGFFALGAFIYNSFIYPILSAFVMLANFIGNVFNDPLTAVVMLFMDMAITCIDYVANMAKTIEDIINKIPGVTVDITSGIDAFSAELKAEVDALKDEHGWKEYLEQPKALDVSAAAEKGYDMGSGLIDKLTGFMPSGLGSEYDFSQFATGGNPATVKGNGKGGAVKVENEEDIEWMRQLAERDYVARISQNTLAPNIRVEFTGPITKEADVDSVAAHMADQLKEIISSAPEGVYP